eukprot:scaffold14635_cov143-Skeletonema_marinoi.AAC.1
MVTLIRTLKRIITSPPPPSKNKPNESKTKRISTPTNNEQQNESSKTQAAPIVHRHRPQNHFSDLAYHNSQVQKTKAATDAVEMSKKRDSSALSNQKAFAFAADTRDETSASMDSDERNTQSDRKRKSSSTYMELPPKKDAHLMGVLIKSSKVECVSGMGQHGQRRNAANGGVCLKHGAQKRLCRMEGCMNGVKNGGVCFMHGAHKRLCRMEGCMNGVIKGGVCIRHGAYRL